MGKALRDFTVAELDALPVGARFVDRAIERERWDEWTYTKGEDGRWARPGFPTSGINAAVLLGTWSNDPYEHDDGSYCDPIDAIRDALEPFAALASHYSESCFHDGYIVLQDGNKGPAVTAGDFRRIVRALGDE